MLIQKDNWEISTLSKNKNKASEEESRKISGLSGNPKKKQKYIEITV